MEKNLTTIFAEHCDILLQDIREAVANRKSNVIIRLTKVMKAIIALYSRICNVSFKEADKILFNVAYIDTESSVPAEFISSINFSRLIRESNACGSSSQQIADDIDCEITTIFAEVFGLSYDDARKAIRREPANAH